MKRHVSRVFTWTCAGALALALGACSGGTSPQDPSQTPPPPLPDPSGAPALKTYFAPNFRIGAAVEMREIDPATSAADIALLQKHFSSITPANVMKADTIGVAEGEYNFEPADELVAFAEANGIEVRGHTLVWYFVTPDWFFEGDKSDPATYHALVKGRLERYITDVVTHFRGKVYAWDVVNEAASNVAGEIYDKNSVWYKAYSIGGRGEDYIEDAFRAARAADPDVKLFLNDYSTEYEAKRENVMAIVKDLLEKGVPIDGVGHQMHSNTYARDAVRGIDIALTEVEQLNPMLINHITELDLSIYKDQTTNYGSEPPLEPLSLQAQQYRALFEIFLKHDLSIDAVTTWGITDANTWLDVRFNRKDHPLLFDAERNPKWAFWAIVDPTIELP